MMPSQQQHSNSRQARLLLIYTIYRLISIFIFLGIFLYNSPQYLQPAIYYLLLGSYFLAGLVFLYLRSTKFIRFESQVLISGTIDILMVSVFLILLGVLQSGFGILLNVAIAALSIMVPGRLAVYFAAFASCLLLAASTGQYILTDQKSLTIFFYSGIYGAGFFATALTALYLANWVRASENLAKHRSQELAGLQRINEYIVERLHSGIAYVDIDGQVKLINTAAKEFFKFPINDQLNNLQQLSSELYDKFLFFLKKSDLRERIAQTILDEPYLKVHFFLTTLGHHPAVLIILDDLMGIAQQAQQLKLASLGRFSASIAHELRNPLGAISHAVQLLGEGDSLSDEDTHLKQLIINNCQRMNGVIKNVLQLSRRQQAKPETIELLPFLKGFKKDFCQMNDCQFVISHSKQPKPTLIFDRSQLEQILVILCENAMQHGRDKKGAVRISIAIVANHREMIIKVCDKGKGVPQEIQNDIFDPFYTTVRSGTGMGLFLARELCEINQARLSLLAEEKGSCFAILVSTSNELLL